MNAASRFQAANARHKNIHHNHIGMKLGCLLDSLLPIFRFSANFPSLMRLKDGSYCLANKGVIVRQQDPNFSTVASYGHRSLDIPIRI